jgi:hypothetical protein
MIYRSIDGSGNNLSRPELNAAGTDFTRIGSAHYADGISSLMPGVNPRTISNVVVGEGDAAVANAEGLSGMMYAWGQFIDHDLDLAASDGVTAIGIPVPAGDAHFPAGSTIDMTRAITDPLTGHDRAHPATAVNQISGWLDASMVYGSSAAIAAGLRLADGHMKAPGGNLPVVNGAWAAGDVRVAENPSLTALQTLFVREHNFQVDQLRAEHPRWSGDQLYQQARAIVGAEIQHITYDEFLPHLVGNAIGRYHGYDRSVDPTISLEFAGAAYRFGHSIVSNETERVDNLGAVTGPELGLKDTFFLTPAEFADGGGADGFLRHLGSDPSQAMDARIVDDLRNFLVDAAGGVSMDLAAINIQRGRDLGLGTLNETREALGLREYTRFEQITDDRATVAAMRQAFGDVDRVDLWTGGLAERHASGAMVGETFRTIIAGQFEALRDGDRFWYQNAGFDRATLGRIEHTSLADLIERNTDTGYIQNDAFLFYSRHSGALGGVASDDPAAPQLVMGSRGDDWLAGGSQGDILVPAAGGHQTLTGGAGPDQFTFTSRGIDATITDYSPREDSMVFDVGGYRAGRHRESDHGMSMRYDHGDTVIDMMGSHIVLENIRPGALDHDNILIA